MKKFLNKFMLLFMVSLVVLTSAISTTMAYADDGTTEEPTEATTPTEETNTETVAPPKESPSPEETVAELLDQVPEGTAVVVVSDEGVEPLASQDAVETILETDPIWCPAGQTPGDDLNDSVQDCTDPYTTATDLIANLGSKSGSGTIYFTPTYNVNDAIFNHTNPNLVNLTDLTIEGGWNGSTGGGYSLSGSTTFSGVPLKIINWTGNVTLNNLIVDAEDSEAGLYVETNGDILLTNVNSSGNSLGYGAALDTCLFDGTSCTGTGNVTVNDSTFDSNDGGSGLGVDSGGTIAIDNVQANGNGGAGAELYNYDLLGSGGITVSDSLFDSNDDNGVWAVSEGAITLTNTDATNNGFDGVDLINYEGTGDVSVTGGVFSDNDEAGLYIDSAGNVTIASITSNDNRNGAVIFTDYGSGSVDISQSVFSDNDWTGLEVTSAGNITLDDVDASGNSVGGAYLNALGGSGDISIVNTFTGTDDFNGNGQYGIHAFANGDITLQDVSVDGLDVSDNGAWLKSFEGNVSVTNSVFTHNQGYGLLAVAAGQVDLVTVTTTFNGGNGAEIYSIYNFACFGNDNILIHVSLGSYSDNGGYGIYMYPGETGTIDMPIIEIPDLSNNGLGETFVETLSNPCPEPEPKPEEGEGKPSNEIIVPEDGTSDSVEQDCEVFSGTTFLLHSGTTIKVDCPFEGNSQVTDTPATELPGRLPVGLTFADAVSIGMVDSEGNPITVLDSGLLTLTFKIPEELMGKRLSILYWDPTAKDGQGDWIELPFDQFGGAYFPLYPDNLDDGRLLCSGFNRSGDTVTVTVNFPGTFVLVAR